MISETSVFSKSFFDTGIFFQVWTSVFFKISLGFFFQRYSTQWIFTNRKNDLGTFSTINLFAPERASMNKIRKRVSIFWERCPLSLNLHMYDYVWKILSNFFNFPWFSKQPKSQALFICKETRLFFRECFPRRTKNWKHCLNVQFS